MLVYHDLLGLTEGHLPRFVKRYASLSGEIRDALEHYAEEVRDGAFPGDEHTYAMDDRGARGLPQLDQPDRARGDERRQREPTPRRAPRTSSSPAPVSEPPRAEESSP